MHWINKLSGFGLLQADNTTLDSGSGGDDVRTIDKSSVKTPVSALDVGGSGTENLVTDGTQGMPTEGVAAENAAVAGNPVVVGGRYDSSPRTLDSGDAGAIALDADGAVQVSDGGNTLTVDGTVTANAGTNLDTSALALESGGNLAGAATSLAVIDDWDESDRAKVNPIVGQAGVAAGAGAVAATVQRVTLASDDPAVAKLGTIDTDTSALAGCVGGTELQVDIVSSAAVPVTDNSGSLTVDNNGTFATQATLAPATSGGLSIFKSVDIDETEEDVKTSAGQIYSIYCVNTNSSIRYLKVYNAAAASVTVGSTATVLDLLIPPSNSGFFLSFPHGLAFSTAICVAATTGVGDSDSGAPGTNEVQVHVAYK